MSRYVIDILSPAANPDCIPRDQNIILLVPDSFLPSREIIYRFAHCNNIDQALTGGSFYFKIQNDLERGLLIGLILGRWPDAKLLTSRPEIYQRLSTRLTVQPYKEKISQFYNNESYASTEASSVCPGSPREEFKAPFSPQKPAIAQQPTLQDRYLDNLYYEVLSKFYERFLNNIDARAPKIKSTKAQLKNLADGTVISVKKKAAPEISDTLPGSTELTEMVYEDLRDHKIIEESGLTIHYNDQLINDYFGREKRREFMPRYKELRNQKPPSPPPPPPPPQPKVFIPPEPAFDKKKALDAAYKAIWKVIAAEVSGGNPEDIGDLVDIIKERFYKNQALEPEMYPECIKEDLIKREILMLFRLDSISLISNSQKTPEFIAENYLTNRKEKILIIQ